MVHKNYKTPKPTIMLKKLIGLISMIKFEVYSGNKVFVKFGENIWHRGLNPIVFGAWH